MIHRSYIAVENNSDEVHSAASTSDSLGKSSDWKSLLSQCKMSTAELLKKVGLEQHPLASDSAEGLFELRVPAPYLDKIEKGNPNDPLLLQILPQHREHLSASGFSSDPLDEKNHSPVSGLIHKYRSRVLLIASQTCAINCRYCFRRSFPYSEHRLSTREWEAPLDYIRQHREVNEVILSGGDPLIHSNDYLFSLLQRIDDIPHITRIRIHSRLISSLPQRIDEVFLARLGALSVKIIIVLHCNHPKEIDTDVAIAAQQLIAHGITLLNQAVLLKDINDDSTTLAQLSERLFDIGILPYYLFTLDKVNGSSHFDIPIQRAKKLHQELLAELPGYLVPRLVSEIPGHPSKTPLI